MILTDEHEQILAMNNDADAWKDGNTARHEVIRHDFEVLLGLSEQIMAWVSATLRFATPVAGFPAGQLSHDRYFTVRCELQRMQSALDLAQNRSIPVWCALPHIDKRHAAWDRMHKDCIGAQDRLRTTSKELRECETREQDTHGTPERTCRGMSTSEKAAEGGHLHVLKWLRANGCPWDEGTCEKAAEGGHLAVLRWARANGCPWDEQTCSSAAFGAHLELLQWARANGCPWDEKACSMAAMGI